MSSKLREEIEAHRARCTALIEDHAAARERLNAMYGEPVGWRLPGTLSTEERLASVNRYCDLELEKIRAREKPGWFSRLFRKAS